MMAADGKLRSVNFFPPPAVEALCIGIDYLVRYKGLRHSKLAACSRDSIKLAKHFKSLGVGRVFVMSDNSALLRNAGRTAVVSATSRVPATPGELTRSITNFIANPRTVRSSVLVTVASHGQQEVDSYGGDEDDGMDEAIVAPNGEALLDDTLRSEIYRCVRQNPRDELRLIVTFFDSCHSGTILDLRYTFLPKQRKWLDNETKQPVEAAGICDASPDRPILISMAGSLENESVWEVPGANGEMYGRFSRAVSTQLQSVRSSVILCFLDVRYELSKEPTDLSSKILPPRDLDSKTRYAQTPKLYSDCPFSTNLHFDGFFRAPAGNQ